MFASGFGNRDSVSVSRPKFPTKMSWDRGDLALGTHL